MSFSPSQNENCRPPVHFLPHHLAGLQTLHACSQVLLRILDALTSGALCNIQPCSERRNEGSIKILPATLRFKARNDTRQELLSYREVGLATMSLRSSGVANFACKRLLRLVSNHQKENRLFFGQVNYDDFCCAIVSIFSESLSEAFRFWWIWIFEMILLTMQKFAQLRVSFKMSSNTRIV